MPTKVIAVASQKGGSGKTTLVIHLAVLAMEEGRKVAIIDTDHQASAYEWWETRGTSEPYIEQTDAAGLREALKVARDASLDYVIVDTPPQVTDHVMECIRAADFTVVPCRPSVIDLKAIPKTINLVKRAGGTAGVVLNACPPRRSQEMSEAAIVTDARQAISAASGVSICPVPIVNRLDFGYALIDGRAITEYDPKGKAAEEIRAFWMWTKENLNE